ALSGARGRADQATGTDPARRPGGDPRRHRAARVPRHRRAHRRRPLPRHGALDEPLPHDERSAGGPRRSAHERVLERGRPDEGACVRRSAVAVLVVAAGCTAIPERTVKSAVSPEPAQPWSPPAKAAMPPAPVEKTAPAIPEEYLKPGTTLSLAQLVDVGLHANPVTPAAWASARAAA